MRKRACREAKRIIRGKSHPVPCAAGKHDVVEHLLVAFDHAVILFLFQRIVIPIDQRNIVRDSGLLLRGQLCGVRIIFALIEQAVEHIAPHHGMIAVSTQDLHHAVEMRDHNIHPVLIPVLVEVFPKAEHMRLIHTDIDPAAGKVLRHCFHHFLDQLVCGILTGQENIAAVAHILKRFPLERLHQVRQCLDTRDEIDRKDFSILVHAAQLPGRIASALVAEIRIFFHFVNILNIEMHPGVAHQGGMADHFAEAVKMRDSVAGAVPLEFQPAVNGSFRRIRKCALRKEAQRARELRIVLDMQHSARGCFLCKDPIRRVFHAHRKSIRIRGKLYYPL